MQKSAALLLTVLLSLFGAIAVFAAPPTLSELPNAPLLDTYRANEPYTLRLVYKNPQGDAPKSAVFVDEAPSGKHNTEAKVVGSDYVNGVTLEWDVTGFEQGAHNGYFLVKSLTGETRYQKSRDPNGFYTFTAENIWLRVGLMGVGLAVGLVFIPFLSYVLLRSINKNGDPASAARAGLLFGILACTALAIYLFAGFFGPLVYAIAIIAGLALIILVFSRR